MHKIVRAATALAAAWVIAGPAAAAAEHAPPSAASSAADGQLVEAGVHWLTQMLEVPATPDIDAPLRDAMVALVHDHLARMRGVMAGWIEQERARGGAGLSDVDVQRAVFNRTINEIALWRLESPGAAYDAVFARAVLRPAVCTRVARPSYLGMLMDEFQAVQPADRATLLAGERTLLAHWGTRRANLPPRPQPSLLDDEVAEIARLRSGASTPDVAMTPVLANNVFKGEERTPALQCALHQWGLARALRRGAAPAEALLAWRYASIKTVESWAGNAALANHNPTDFPPIAASGGVTGKVDLLVTPDAQGRFASATIVGRSVEVPGVADNPPVAFETVFDAASLASAPTRFKPVAPLGNGATPNRVPLRVNWSLQ